MVCIAYPAPRTRRSREKHNAVRGAIEAAMAFRTFGVKLCFFSRGLRISERHSLFVGLNLGHGRRIKNVCSVGPDLVLIYVPGGQNWECLELLRPVGASAQTYTRCLGRPDSRAFQKQCSYSGPISYMFVSGGGAIRIARAAVALAWRVFEARFRSCIMTEPIKLTPSGFRHFGEV